MENNLTPEEKFMAGYGRILAHYAELLKSLEIYGDLVREQANKEGYNQAIRDAAENVIIYVHDDDVTTDFEVEETKQSILKLLKPE